VSLRTDEPDGRPRIFKLADLQSACDRDLAAPNRLDPYWGGQFPHHDSNEWFSRSTLEAQSDAGLLTPPDKLLAPAWEARHSMTHANRDRSPYGLNTYVAIAGAITGWRTCTSQQLAALVGDARLAKPLGHPVTHLFNAGLIALSVPHPWASGPAKDLTLLRAGDPAHFGLIEPDLTWAEWVGITGGQPYGGSHHHDRHNILATELGLRLAEYAHVAAVLGEPFSTHNLLFGEGAGRDVDQSPGGADLTVVRPDGLRIAVELTSTTSPYFDAKVERVVKRLAESPLATTGTAVVFLVAPSIGATQGHHKSVLQVTKRAIREACRRHPGIGLDPSRARIGVALWQDWFPAAHTASDGFFGMRASRLASFGPEGSKDAWEQVDYLSPDAFRFVPKDPNAMQTILLNAGLLGQTPHWLRDLLLDRLDGIEATASSAGGRGAAKPPRVPSRILGLGTEPAVARHLSNVRAVGYAGTSRPSPDWTPVSATEARRQRAIALLDITQERRTITDVLKGAVGKQPHPYGAIPLAQLLAAQPRFGVARAEQLLDRLAAVLGQDRPDADETVAWLLDDRSGRRRLLAWMEVLRAKRTERGFPWR
jgi:hypothetical protein